MYVPCRLCGGPSTSGDGAGAPCRRCIQIVVSTVAAQPADRDQAALASTLYERLRPVITPNLGPCVDPWSVLPALVSPELPERTFVERTFMEPALARLPQHVADMVMLAALPAFVIERSMRQRGRHPRPLD